MEDFFLKHSVMMDKDDDEVGPNRRSIGSDSQDSGNEDNGIQFKSAHDPSGPWNEYFIPSYQKSWIQSNIQYKKSSNTGPKGVINDYNIHKKNVSIQKENDMIIRTETLKRIAKDYVGQEIINPAINIQYQDKEMENDSDNTDNEDTFIRDYRKKRLLQLQEECRNSIHKSKLQMIQPEELLMILQKSNIYPIVVHLFEPDIRKCQIINVLLDNISKKHNDTQFICMKASEADDTINFRDLPLILIYQNGNLIESIVDLNKRNIENITINDMEDLLKKNGAFWNSCC